MSETNGIERDESENLDKLAAALAKAQASMTHADKSREAPVTKDGTVKRRYATLADVMDASRPHLNANGLSVSQHVSNGNGSIIVTSWLLHESGQWMRSRFAMPRSESNNVSVPQALGISISYARRYAWAALTGVAVEDDDGADGSANKAKRERSETREAPKGEDGGKAPLAFPNYGKAAGQAIQGAALKDLEFYLNGVLKGLEDPKKERFKASNEAMAAAIRAEIGRQQGSAAPESNVKSVYEQAGLLIAGAEAPGKVDQVLQRAEGKVTLEQLAELSGLGRRRKLELAAKAPSVPDPDPNNGAEIDEAPSWEYPHGGTEPGSEG
jgi:hypothetical protein